MEKIYELSSEKEVPYLPKKILEENGQKPVIIKCRFPYKQGKLFSFIFTVELDIKSNGDWLMRVIDRVRTSPKIGDIK